MKTPTTKRVFLAIALAASVSASARAEFCVTWDEFPSSCVYGWWTWNSTYQAIQSAAESGCSFHGPLIDFCLPSQTNMQAIANSRQGRVSFDLFVNDDSFLVGNWSDGAWYQIFYVGNSDGLVGWSQPDVGGIPSGVYTTSGPNDHAWHFNLTFAQIGWEPGDTWFQLQFFGNSECDNPLGFFVDNICVDYLPSLLCQPDGDRIVLTWSDPRFVLQSAPESAGVYTNVPNATSPYTNSVTGARQFFRLKW